MKRIVLAALALGIVAMAPASAQVTQQRTTFVERPNGATVVRRTTVRRTETRRYGYGRPHATRVCKVRYRDGRRIRTCRTVNR